MTTTIYDDGIQALNISATPVTFPLLGGLYGVVVEATFGGGSVALQVVAPDGSTLISVLPNFTTNGFANIDLPAGQYSLTITTATAVYASVSRIRKV